MLDKNTLLSYFAKRYIRYSVVALITALVSLCLTLWIIYGVGEEDNSVQIGPTTQTKEIDAQILFSPSLPQNNTTGTITGNASRKQSDGSTSKNRVVTVYPQWIEGNTHIENAGPITLNGHFANPIWSPLNLDIAFVSETIPSYIFVTNPNETTSHTLTPLFQEQSVPKHMAWNSDGMSLNLEYHDEQAITLFITGETAPAIDVERHVWERDGYIWWQPSEDATPICVSGSNDRFHSPILSPDKRRVVYSSLETGLYITHLTTADAGLIETISIGRGQHPSWLSDSRGIVYDVAESVGDSVVYGDLWYATVDGTERTNITNTDDKAEAFPVVSSDGEHIAFCSDGAIYVGRFGLSY
ncbi:MAG: hypothetical protein PHX74_06880 [Candidatus Sumerlaeales bacterium]|nr:hypothetical protein [Candidatus Sumerlaeales bacterium]